MDLQKRKKNYFTSHGYQKKRKQFVLEAGMTGFLCTCNFREKDCVRDAYKILNEFYDDENTKEDNDSGEKGEELEKDNTEEDKSDDDISTALNKEINQLKGETNKPVAMRRFQVVDTGVKNVIFISSSIPNPVELVTKIIKELDKSKQQRTRFLLRLIPAEVVCKAFMNDIRTKADVLFGKYFIKEPKTFSIVFNRHSNNSIQRSEIIEDLAELIAKKNPGNKADLKNPELAVLVEVIRGVCLLSVVPHYYKYKKYNLLEICNTKEKEPTKEVVASEENNKIELAEEIKSKDESGIEMDTTNSQGEEDEKDIKATSDVMQEDTHANAETDSSASQKSGQDTELINEDDPKDVEKAEVNPSTNN